jgi:hypothetical protein
LAFIGADFPCSGRVSNQGLGRRALSHREKSLDDHAAEKTPSRAIEDRQDCQGPNKKVWQEIIRPCWRRIAALLQKQLPFCSRCVMSAHPKQTSRLGTHVLFERQQVC